MKLYIMRHAFSPTTEDAGVERDFDRPISQSGRQDVKKIAAYIKEKGGNPSTIYSSPLIRAQQTSKELSQALGSTTKVSTYDPLGAHLTGVDLFRRILQDEIKDEEFIVLGHQPQIGELAHHLTGRYITLNPGGIVSVKTDGKECEYLWSINPEEIEPS